MRAYRYSGHDNYVCRTMWLYKVMDAVEMDPFLFTDKDAAWMHLGVGLSMVKPMLFWAKSFGLIERWQKGDYSITPFGQLLLECDPFFEDSQTLWLLHWRITTEKHFPLLAWRYVFNYWNTPEWKQSELIDALYNEMNGTVSLEGIKQHASVFARTYRQVDLSAISVEEGLDNWMLEVGLLDTYGELSIQNHEATFYFDRREKSEIGDRLFLYAVNEFWETAHRHENSMDANELVYKLNSPGRVFKMEENEVMERIERLDYLTKGAITYQPTERGRHLCRHRELDTNSLLRAIYD